MLSGIGKKFLTRLARANSALPNRGYHQIIVDHYENPRNVGSLDKFKINVGTGLLSFVCFYLNWNDELVILRIGWCACMWRCDEVTSRSRCQWCCYQCQVQDLWLWKCNCFFFSRDRMAHRQEDRWMSFHHRKSTSFYYKKILKVFFHILCVHRMRTLLVTWSFLLSRSIAQCLLKMPSKLPSKMFWRRIRRIRGRRRLLSKRWRFKRVRSGRQCECYLLLQFQKTLMNNY